MRRRKMLHRLTFAAVALVTVAFITAKAHRSLPDSAMQDLSSADQLKQRLQQDSGKVQLIILVSPICPACRRGFADMQSVLKNVPDDRLRTYIVWLPMFPGDSRSWAQTRSNEFSDPRLSYYWDGGRVTGDDWGKALGIDRTAWDVYFLYGANAKWSDGTPTPAFWMHQLGGVTKAPMLNKNDFEAKVKELLASTK
ncbi:MAG TPA: hypothetical protein VLB68_15735 [Pyrinomonadaceae bacterium]|nr:hypothetical protein [Pyrinomonadaceae bacterium]